MRLIDADALHADLSELATLRSGSQVAKGLITALEAIHDAPTIEAEPVRHGRWEEHPDVCSLFRGWECSECKQIISGGRGNYCPNCGAKMDGGEDV